MNRRSIGMLGLICGLLLGAGRVAAEPVTLHVASWINYSNVSAWDEIITSFEHDYPDITIDFMPMAWGAYWTKVPLMLQAGDLDVIDMTVAVLPQMVKDGLLLDLTPLAKADLNPDDYYQTSLDRGRWPYPGGRLWTIWTMMSPSVFYYNTELFDDAGVAPPNAAWTYANQMAEAIRKLSRDTNGDGVLDAIAAPAGFDGDGIANIINSYGVQTVRDGFGARTYTADGTRFDLATPQNEAALEYVYGFEAQGLTPRNVGENDFIAGKVAMQFHGTWLMPELAAQAKFKWATAQPPAGAAGHKTTLQGNPSMAISAKSKHVREAWLFVRHVLTHQTATSVPLAGNIPTKRSAALDWIQRGESLWPGLKPDVFKEILANTVYTAGISPYQDKAQKAIADVMGRADKGEIPIKTALAEATRLANAAIAK